MSTEPDEWATSRAPQSPRSAQAPTTDTVDSPVCATTLFLRAVPATAVAAVHAGVDE